MSLFQLLYVCIQITDDMILHIENPTGFTANDKSNKLLKLINKFNKVAGYKINIHKSAVFLYTNKELSKRKLRKNSIYNSNKS